MQVAVGGKDSVGAGLMVGLLVGGMTNGIVNSVES